MALQTSGAISLNDIHIEAGGGSGTLVSINDADVRSLIGAGSATTMSFSDFYGASSSASFVGAYTTSINQANAFSYITASNPINLTGAGVQAGDLVVLAMASDRNLSANATFSGMTLTSLSTESNTQTPGWLAQYGFWQSGNSNPYPSSYLYGGRPLAVVAAIFRNTNSSLLNYSESNYASGMPDPPSLSSVAGTKLIVALGHLDDDAVTMTAGSGYTLAGSRSATYSYDNASVGIQYKITSTSTTENPPVFGGGGSDSWKAYTLRF